MMGVYVTTAERGRVRGLLLAGLLLLAVVVLLLALLPLAAAAMLVGLAVGGAALLAQRAAGLRAAVRAARPSSAPAPGPLLQIVDAEGELIAARAVPLPGQSEQTLALTRDGYLLLDADGRVIHRL